MEYFLIAIFLFVSFALIAGIGFIFLTILSRLKEEKALKSKSKIDKTHKVPIAMTNKSVNIEQLNKTKEWYPFEEWKKNFFEFQMEQYTEKNCNRGKEIFDVLISELSALGEQAEVESKTALIEKAVKS